ncbi:MAG: PLP-dependent aminotransferase family protein [Clostridia bacterium]|nr:PLP-dependent aminotransferase family protein [Clostridia bacterium]
MDYFFSDRISGLKPSAIREILKYGSDPKMIGFSAGNPAPESFPVSEMKEISAEIFDTMASSALQYGITEGYTPLREKVKSRLITRFNSVSEDDEVIITSGGQQGLELACKVLCNEGDTVLCEDPSFIGALNAFRSYNVNLVGVKTDSEGIIISELEAALKKEKKVRFLYTIPTFHNPTGKTLSLERRRAIYELACKYNIMILEDNPYGELRFKGKDVPTLKSMDVEGRVIYCGSFSKILSAGIRLGFVSANKALVSKMTVAKQVSDVHTNQFFQILADKYLEKYDLDAHIAKIRELYLKKATLMRNGLLESSKDILDKVTYTDPEGGLFMWAELPKGFDVIKLSQNLLARCVAIVPGVAFAADPSLPVSAFRLNYSTPSDEQIVNGTRIVGEEIAKLL